MHSLHHDVLIIGGGGAGLRAALAVAEVAPELRVGLASKVYPKRGHTGAAEGGATAVVLDEDRLDEQGYDTISGGDWLYRRSSGSVFGEQQTVELFVFDVEGILKGRDTDVVRKVGK